jgi:TIR domain-containing protein
LTHIFLSYSRKDSPIVDVIARQLQGAQFTTWVDRRGIAGGQQWRREIVSAIQAANLFMLFLSPQSARSENVRKELDLADEAKVPIFPVALAPTNVPNDMLYVLAGVQVIEIWRDRDHGIASLIQSLQRRGLSQNAQKARDDRSNVRPPASSVQGSSALDLSQLGGRSLLEWIGGGWRAGRKRRN